MIFNLDRFFFGFLFSSERARLSSGRGTALVTVELVGETTPWGFCDGPGIGTAEAAGRMSLIGCMRGLGSAVGGGEEGGMDVFSCSGRIV